MTKDEGARGAAGVGVSCVFRYLSGIVVSSVVIQRKAPYG